MFGVGLTRLVLKQVKSTKVSQVFEILELALAILKTSFWSLQIIQLRFNLLSILEIIIKTTRTIINSTSWTKSLNLSRRLYHNACYSLTISFQSQKLKRRLIECQKSEGKSQGIEGCTLVVQRQNICEATSVGHNRQVNPR